MLKECNIGGGVATFKASHDGGLPRLFFKNIREKWKSGRWSPGKEGGEVEENLLFSSKMTYFSVTGVSSWWGDFTQ